MSGSATRRADTSSLQPEAMVDERPERSENGPPQSVPASSPTLTTPASNNDGLRRSKVPKVSKAKLKHVGHELTSKSAGYFSLMFTTGAAPFDYVLIAIGIVGAIAAGIPFPLLGILFGELVDDMNTESCGIESDGNDFQRAVNTKVLNVVYLAIANFCFIYIHTSCWSLVGERLVRRLRERYFKALLRQDIAFFDSLPAGEVSSRLTVDLETVSTGTSEKVGICISSFSYFVAAYVVAFIKVPKLAGMLVSLVPAFMLMAFVGGKFVKKHTTGMLDQIAAATAIASESLRSIAVVHAFGANRRLEAIYSQHILKAQTMGAKKAFASSAQLATMYFIGYSANALAFWQGSRMIAASVNKAGNGATVGGIYTAIFVLLDATAALFYAPGRFSKLVTGLGSANIWPASFIISQVAPFLQIFGAAAGASGKLLETIERTSKIDGTSATSGQSLPTVVGDIQFENAHFAYPSRPEVQVLDDFTLTIPAKKHTALVGLTGSGKSTVAALLQRLYDPLSGRVLLDGLDLRDINVRELRGHISVIQQEPVLFDRSILENIAHGLVNSVSPAHSHLKSTILDSTLPKIVQDVRNGQSLDEAAMKYGPAAIEIVALARKAATLADALDFIEKLVHGFATSVGSAGGQLSGGQKQRIALSRALVRDPQILILDEATAALDSSSERRIQSALDKAAEGRTTIAIAHRLSTVKRADNIVVMEKGRIVEQGPHEELLKLNGTYARFVSLQTVGSDGSSANARLSRAPTLGGDSSPVDSIEFEGATLEDKTGVQKTETGTPDSAEGEKDPKKSSQESKDGEKPAASAWHSLVVISKMGRPQFMFMLLGLLTSTIIGGAFSGEAVVFGHTVSVLSPCRGAANILSSGRFYGLLFFILALIELGAQITNGSSFGWVSEKMLCRVRLLCLRTLLRQDIHWHESGGRTSSSLLSYLTTDANALGSLTGIIIGTVFIIMVNMVAGIALAHAIAWKIAVVLLATVPILLGAGYMRLHVLGSFQQRHQKAFANSVSLTLEAVNSIKTIAGLSLEGYSYEVYRRSLKSPYDATLRAIAWSNFWLAMSFSITLLVYALAYWWGAKQVEAGLYTQTQFFIVLPALLFSSQSCGQLFSLAPDITKAALSVRNVVALLDIGGSSQLEEERGGSVLSTAPSQPEKQDLEAAEGIADEKPAAAINRGVSVSFQNVRFSYPTRPDVEVLRGLSIDIRPGQFCALVGPSGSGKSTVLALLEKFYPPSSGTIAVDGKNISAWDSENFRHDIALVPQDTALFDGTIRFNLALGARPDREPADAEIQDACRLANIHDTIAALPDGYDTRCGPNGSQFSGGQKQRLSIARALIRRPRLLLLDESTSALDAESERLVQASLEKVARNVTVLAIAHRLSTIAKAHRIFLIEAGVCVDSGSHQELLLRNASYRENVLHQALDAGNDGE